MVSIGFSWKLADNPTLPKNKLVQAADASSSNSFVSTPSIALSAETFLLMTEKYNLTPPLQVSKYRFKYLEREKKKPRKLAYIIAAKPSQLSGSTIYMYNFRSTIKNATANVHFTFFSPLGDVIIGHPYIEVAQKYRGAPQSALPIEITDIIEKKHLF
ncbi:hypothetical protein Tco_1262717 [Tanacetum coccineum]